MDDSPEFHDTKDTGDQRTDWKYITLKKHALSCMIGKISLKSFLFRDILFHANGQFVYFILKTGIYYETSEKTSNNEHEGKDNIHMVAYHVCDMWHWHMDFYH